MKCTATPKKVLSTLFVHASENSTPVISGERRTLTTKSARETEAEALSFVVCQAIGLQTGSAASDYIQIWNGDANLLRESLEAVQQSAAVILGGITPQALT